MKASALTLSKKYFLNTKALFFIFSALLVGVFFLYVYLVNAAVMNVVTRERVTGTMSELSTTVGNLEYQYMNLKNGVTLDLAYEKGFKDTSPTTFLARTSASPVLSYNSSR